MKYIGESFHYPQSKSPQYTEQRQAITDKYGDITLVVLGSFLLGVSVINSLIKKGVYIHSKVQFIKWLNRFDHNRVAMALKRGLIFMLYHLPSILQISFWLIILTTLSLSELNHGDLIFLAKRLGRIANNCLPTILFLSLRPSPLPNTLYLSLIPIHKWLSRIVILQSVLHTVLYCGYFQVKHNWFKAIKWDNIWGWLPLASFCIIFITSLSRFRNAFYKVFYCLHYTLTWIIVICLQFHIRPTRPTYLTILNLGILLGQIIYRVKLTKLSNVEDLKIFNVSPNLLLIEFPVKLITKPGLNPGSHIRLTNYSKNFYKALFNQIVPNYHPYSLVSLPTDFKQKLIIKKGNFKFLDNQQYYITGSYDANLLFIHNKENQFQISKLVINTKRVLIVIGGSAISFALPILRVMNYHGIPIKIVWVIKDFRDIAILKYFDGHIHGDDFEIFVTGDETIDDLKSPKSYGTFTFDHEITTGINHEANTDELTKLLSRKNFEDEDVDIAIDNDQEEDIEAEECDRPDAYLSTEPNDISSINSINSSVSHDTHDSHDSQQSQHSIISHKTITSNERFLPKVRSLNDCSKSYLNNYNETIKRLNINNKIYKGRPVLNHRYYNWCLHDGFTQCSGPVEINHNMVCCKDLPRNNVSTNDASKIWVVSAGPKGLVNNVKFWANENGLKFHEEAFYT